MEPQNPRSRIGGSWTAQLLATRRGAMTVAALAAILAGVLLYLFVQHYKSNSTTSAAAPASIFVFQTTKYIPAGTPAETLASEGLLQKVQVSSKQAQAGAISDPSVITGEVSATNIAKGQQVTAADFTHANVTIGAYLTGTQRAIAVPLDAPHGLTAYLTAGNTVDMMVDNGGTSSVLAQNLSVLENSGGDVVLRVTDKQALQISAAADSTKLWLVLRPPTGAQESVRIGSKGTY
jgi:Flp pilus assembly protein CpaB